MSKKEIVTNNAPKAIGPYSQGIDASPFVFTSGQIPIDPATGKVVSDDIKEQTVQVFKNLKGILEESGLSFDNVVKTTVFITDMADFAAVNEIYKEYFNAPFPARSCVQVAALPLGVKVEIETICIR